MSSRVIVKLANNLMAVMALQAHTSDRHQPHDVSVFGPFKHKTNKAVHRRLKSFRVVSGCVIRNVSLDM